MIETPERRLVKNFFCSRCGCRRVMTRSSLAGPRGQDSRYTGRNLGITEKQMGERALEHVMNNDVEEENEHRIACRELWRRFNPKIEPMTCPDCHGPGEHSLDTRHGRHFRLCGTCLGTGQVENRGNRSTWALGGN